MSLCCFCYKLLVEGAQPQHAGHSVLILRALDSGMSTLVPMCFMNYNVRSVVFMFETHNQCVCALFVVASALHVEIV